MSLFEDRSCGCGDEAHPSTAPIPSGLSTLPLRQRAGFPEYRHALLAAIPGQPSLQAWRARGAGDLGVMLLESWAYVLDVTGFYDARIAERAYIKTAPDALQAGRIVNLLGYQPRGAVSATVQLAIEADGVEAVTLPARTGFRSDAFDDQPPQVFESDADWSIWPARNRWTLGPIRDAHFDGSLRFGPRGAPASGSVLWVGNATSAAVARVADVVPDPDRAGGTLQKLVLSQGADAVMALAGQVIDGMSCYVLRLALGPTGYGTAYTKRATDGDLLLDSLYAQVRAGQIGAIELDGVLTPVMVTAVAATTVIIDSTSQARMGVTRVTLAPALTIGTGQTPIFHAVPVPTGPLRSLARTEIGLADLMPQAGLAAPFKAIGEAPASGPVLAKGQGKRGEVIDATMLAASTENIVIPAAGNPAFATPLITPVQLFGNIVTAIQGESVIGEVLGSGNAGKPWNSFILKKKPLAWREDPSQPGGRRPDIVVRVNGIVWTWVVTLFDQKPLAEVFTVRTLPDGRSEIRFGDGKRGLRVPTGVDNIQADYRFGAGAKTPPPGAIGQFVNKPKDISAVHGPLPATGGADAESADDLRTAAPQSALTLGRAVSIADFEALARSFSGITNVTAAWTWDGKRQRAAVRLWVIDSSGQPGDRLRDWLAGQAAPDIGIDIQAALPASISGFSVSLAFADRHDPAVVQAAAWQALFGETGLLSPSVQRIGAPLFRSAVMAALHAVPGVAGVTEILVNGVPMPAGIGPGEGKWFDVAALAIVR